MKKLFTLLTLLVLLGGGKSWGADEIVFSAVCEATDDANVSAGTSNQLLTASEATLSGGTMSVTSTETTNSRQYLESSQGESGNKKKCFAISASKVSFKITLDQALQVGDKINFIIYTSSTSNYTVGLNLNNKVTCEKNLSESQVWTSVDEYVVEEGDGLCGETEITLTRSQGNGTYFTNFTITRETGKTASDLTIIGEKSTIVLAESGTYTLTKGIDYTTTSTGAITYTSANNDIATVNSSGVITAVAAGNTTIKLSQASDATYLAKNVTFTIQINAPRAKSSLEAPTGTLDLSDADAASTMLNGTWHKDYGRVLLGNDGSNNFITFNLVAAYSSTSGQTWIGQDAAGSSNDSWDATGVFKGSAAYNMSTSKRTNLGSAKLMSFRVKGVSKVQLLVDSRGTSKPVYLSAYEVSGGTVSTTTTLYRSIATNSIKETITLELDDSKEYVIEPTGASDFRVYEMALFYDEAVELHEAITTAKEYVTYVTTNAIDFTGSGLTAYVATSASASAVTVEEVTVVPAKTPLILKGVASTEYKIPVAISASAPATNLLKAGDGTTDIGGDGNYDYILSDGKFYHASPAGPVAVGKAYLHLDDEPAAGREFLEIEIDGYATGINMVNGEGLKVNGSETYYDLQGRRVLYPTKGLYIVNGKKVIVK